MGQQISIISVALIAPALFRTVAALTPFPAFCTGSGAGASFLPPLKKSSSAMGLIAWWAAALEIRAEFMALDDIIVLVGLRLWGSRRVLI
jgi:hypothetical protein